MTSSALTNVNQIHKKANIFLWKRYIKFVFLINVAAGLSPIFAGSILSYVETINHRLKHELFRENLGKCTTFEECVEVHHKDSSGNRWWNNGIKIRISVERERSDLKLKIQNATLWYLISGILYDK